VPDFVLNLLWIEFTSEDFLGDQVNIFVIQSAKHDLVRAFVSVE